MNEALLKTARSAAAEVAEHERLALLSRGAYHAAIRRLHLAGGSLREIAEALSLSHQRVQQIVEAGGGSWWRRGGRTQTGRDAVCTWCSRPSSEVSKLVAGPNVYICDACLELAGAALHDAWGTSETLRRAPDGAKERCGFCRKRGRGDRALVLGPAAHICSECMRISRDLMDGSGGGASSAPTRSALTRGPTHDPAA